LSDAYNGWKAPIGAALTLTFKSDRDIAGVRLIFDSNLANEKRMPCSYPQKHDRSAMPESLVKRFKLEVRRGSVWSSVGEFENAQRLRHIAVNTRGDALRLHVTETWGGSESRVLGFEATHQLPAHLPKPAERIAWSEVVARVNPADLAPPANQGPPGHASAAHTA
jgi:hypothetical protein